MTLSFSPIFSSIRSWWREIHKREIMSITYHIPSNKIQCFDWVSEKIYSFSGEYSDELLEEIKPYCRLGDFPHTRISIWAGETKKHLAYLEPVENYLNNKEMLKTGQGFHYLSGIRYGESMPLKCPTCKRKY